MKPFVVYAAKRLALIPVGLLVVISVSFGLVSLVPGDPARAIAGGLASEETLGEIREELGLNAPLGERYLVYIGRLATGDLGTSFYSGIPVSTEIAERLPDTMELIVLALIVSVAIGITLGGIGAYFRGGIPDRITRATTSIIQSIPDFSLGIGLIFVFYFLLGWVPPPVGRLSLTESRPPGVTGALIIDSALTQDWSTLGSALMHSILPVLTLGIFYSAYFAKTARASLGAAFASKQVEFARACGLPRRTIWSYALREARTPILTYGALLLAVLLGGAAIVEIVFAWGGVGQWAVERILSNDIPAIQGFVVVAGSITLVTYVVLDVLVAKLDPRITYTAT